MEVVVAALEARTGTRWCANSLRARVRRLCRYHPAEELIDLLYGAPAWAGMPMLVRWCETHAGPGHLAEQLTAVDTPALSVSDESARAAVLDLSMRLSSYVGTLLVEECDTLDGSSDDSFGRSVTLAARVEGLQEAVRFLVGSLSPTPAMA